MVQVPGQQAVDVFFFQEELNQFCTLLGVGAASFGAGAAQKLSFMTSKKVYDLCVIGGGPAGWAGAVRAWDLGKKVCLVERREGLGGAAVWGGAMGKHVMQVHHTGPRLPVPSRATHVRATLT